MRTSRRELLLSTAATVVGTAEGAASEVGGSPTRDERTQAASNPRHDPPILAVSLRGERKGAIRVIDRPDLDLALAGVRVGSVARPTSPPDWELLRHDVRAERYRYWTQPSALSRELPTGGYEPLESPTSFPDIWQSSRRLDRPIALPAPEPPWDRDCLVFEPRNVTRCYTSWNRYASPGICGYFFSSKSVFAGRVEGVADTFSAELTQAPEWTSYAVRILEDFKPDPYHPPNVIRLMWPGSHRKGGKCGELPVLSPGQSYLFFTSPRSKSIRRSNGVAAYHTAEEVDRKLAHDILGIGLFRVVNGCLAPPFPEWHDAMLAARSIRSPWFRRPPTSHLELRAPEHTRVYPEFGMPWRNVRHALLSLKRMWQDPAIMAPPTVVGFEP